MNDTPARSSSRSRGSCNRRGGDPSAAAPSGFTRFCVSFAAPELEPAARALPGLVAPVELGAAAGTELALGLHCGAVHYLATSVRKREIRSPWMSFICTST